MFGCALLLTNDLLRLSLDFFARHPGLSPKDSLAEKGVWSMVKMGLSAEAPKVSQCCWSQRLFRKKMSIREVKIVFLGSSGVGKTSLVRSFVTKQFTPNVDTTIGASYLTKVMRVDGVGKTEEYEGVTQIVKVSLSQLTGLVNLKVLLGGNFEDSIYYSHTLKFPLTQKLPTRMRRSSTSGTPPDKRSTNLSPRCITEIRMLLFWFTMLWTVKVSRS